MISSATLLAAACGGAAPPPPDLAQAAGAIAHMLKPSQLSRSAFTAGFPEGKPSEYVSYLFSDMGAAEWPASEEWADELEREQMKAIRAPLLPAGVAIVPRERDAAKGRQLVVGFDDERGVVIFEGFAAGEETPVLHREVPLPSVAPAPGVVDMYLSATEMGMSSQSF